MKRTDQQAADAGDNNTAVQKRASIEYKGLPISLALKDIDQKQGIVTGYAASFNVVDDGRDNIQQGAFKKTIAEWGAQGANRITHLYQHQRDLVLGKPHVLKEDDFGLYFETKISPTSWGRDILILYQDGIINEHSIGYDTITEKHDRETNVRKLLELRLWDISSVTWGMNQFTPTIGVKDMNAQDFEKYLKEFEAINRVLRKNVSDATAHDLEFRLRQLKQAFVDLQDALMHTPTVSRVPQDQPQNSDDALLQITASMKSNLERMNNILKKG